MATNLSRLYPTNKSKFQETHDFHYVILAIGESPDEPPDWAMAACVSFFEECRIAVQTFEDRKKKRGGPTPKHNITDGALLLQVARLVAQRIALTTALRTITKEDADGATFKRLQRSWNGALRDERFSVQGQPRAKTNKWLQLARHELLHEDFLARYQAAIEEREKTKTDEQTPDKPKKRSAKPRRT